MDFGSLEEQFNGLAIKFVFVCGGLRGDESELNALLSELNGLDYKNQQITSSQSIFQFLDSLTKIPVSSDPNVIAKATHLIKQLISKQKVLLPEIISTKIIQWIVKCCEAKSADLFYCEAVDALSALFKSSTALSAVLQVSSSILSCQEDSFELFVTVLSVPSKSKWNSSKIHQQKSQ